MIEQMTKIRLKYVTADVDRHGNVRYYFRKQGHAKVRLLGMPGSDEFMERYKTALAGECTIRRPVRKLPRPDYGTLRWLVVEYYGSNNFKSLAPRTQRVRRNILDKVCEKAGSERITGITTVVIMKGRDNRSDRPEAANAFVKSMRALLGYAVETQVIPSNPARDVRLIRSKSDGFHTWTVDEIRQFEKRHPAGTKARLALHLLLYTGQRRSDAVVLGRQHVGLRDQTLTFTQIKTRERLTLPILPELQTTISTSPVGDLTFLVTAFGKPFSPDGFGNWFRDRCDEGRIATLLRAWTPESRRCHRGREWRNRARDDGHIWLAVWQAGRSIYQTRKSEASCQEGNENARSQTDREQTCPTSEEKFTKWDNSRQKNELKQWPKKRVVPRGGIEPPTLRFSIACSTN
jgi:integrase